jgi:carbon storage regulator CsrA
MHIFQRGVNESLMIGPNVVVTVLEVTPCCVRIAVRNSGATPSYREETIYLEADDDDVDADSVLLSECDEQSQELALSGSGYLNG